MLVFKKNAQLRENLTIKLGEAKNLIGRQKGNTNRDVYCTIALDQEEICRTQPNRNGSPFFGEEFQFEIPRIFRYLSVYVRERDRHLKQDKAIGKIAIRKEDLHIYNHKDHWFPLRPVDEDSEVQGMAHIEVRVLDDTTSRSDDHSKENHSKNVTSNNYTTTTVIPTASNSNHKAPRLLFSTNAIQPANLQHQTLNKSGSQQDISLISVSNSKHSTFQHYSQPQATFCWQQRLQVRLLACSDLTKKNNACDPYAIVTAVYSNKKTIKKRTKVCKKTIQPQFEEVFEFNLFDYCAGSGTNSGNSSDTSSNKGSGKNYAVAPLNGTDLCEVIVSIWHDAGMADPVFLGEIKLPVRGKQQLKMLQPNAWYFLLPRTSQSRPVRSCATPPGTRLSCGDNSIGSLRIKLHFTADNVFPLATYDNLLNILIQSVDQRPITSSAVYLLGEMIINKQEIAQPLVRLFTNNNLIVAIIKRLAEHEISKLTDATTIFRGNTLVSKMMDEAMKLSGLHYLHLTLRPIVELILHEKKPCEIDPTRIKERTSIEQNLNNLHEYVEKVFEAIIQSASKCPPLLCQIFSDLRESATNYFPHNKEVRYSVVSGFIFLRFFAPAILGPKLFDLTAEPLDEQTNRTLTLISKTIQSLGNLVSSRSAQQPSKEQYTGELYKKFCTEKHVEAVKNFLEAISTGDQRMAPPSETDPVLLKDGMMTKRAQGRKRFGRRNFKQRYFRLTTQSLSYAKAKGKRPICDIPLSEIESVERLEERSFKMQHIFRIIRKDRPLYIQTANCVEEKDWMDLLSKICENNLKRTEFFHPCAYINNEWTCCKENEQFAKGCKSVLEKPFDIDNLVTKLDPARDLQRLHALIIGLINEKKIEDCFKPNYQFNSEDPMQCRQTLQKLVEYSANLEQIHHKYRNNLLGQHKYGSITQPIGDDNYVRGQVSQIQQQLNAVSAQSQFMSGASTTPRPHQTQSHFDISPGQFQRNNFLRSSDSERF